MKYVYYLLTVSTYFLFPSQMAEVLMEVFIIHIETILLLTPAN